MCDLKVIPCVRPPKEWRCWKELHHSLGYTEPEDIAWYIQHRMAMAIPEAVYLDAGGNVFIPVEETYRAVEAGNLVT
jgi:hypothetical protein